jgi:hypothetical protein
MIAAPLRINATLLPIAAGPLPTTATSLSATATPLRAIATSQLLTATLLPWVVISFPMVAGAHFEGLILGFLVFIVSASGPISFVCMVY